MHGDFLVNRASQVLDITQNPDRQKTFCHINTPKSFTLTDEIRLARSRAYRLHVPIIVDVQNAESRMAWTITS